MTRAGAQSVEFCARTHVGRARTRNEDAYAVRAERAWAVLADGMGGYRGGDVASRLAVEAIVRRLDGAAGRSDAAAVSVALADAVRDANGAILAGAREQPELVGMGSTVVVAAFVPGFVVSAHVGDSRLYRLHGAVLEALTRDHTMLQEQIDAGMMSADDARRIGFKGMLTRGLGVSDVVEPELGVQPARPGDIFLMCSDGLTDMVPDDEIAGAIDSRAPLDASAQRLVELANQHGGRDNISVILARVAG